MLQLVKHLVIKRGGQMKKEYNRNTLTDMPLDASFNATTSSTERKITKTSKPKINAIGKKATNELQRKTAKPSKPATKTKTVNEDKNVKTKLTKNIEFLDDLEKLNEENLKTFQTKTKRNRFVIVLLSIALAAAIAVISVYLVITNLKTNCVMNVYGARATYIVDGEEMSRFRAPSNVQGNRILKLDIKLKIEESGSFYIRFQPKCYQNGKLMENTLIYEANLDLFYEEADGSYYSKKPIKGKQTIQLCEGIILDYYYKDTLNINNFKMEFETYLEEI